MLGLEARVAVNAVTAVLVFCESSSSVHLFQINTEMPSSRFKHVKFYDKITLNDTLMTQILFLLFSTMIFFIKRIAADMFKSRAWHFCINLK